MSTTRPLDMEHEQDTAKVRAIQSSFMARLIQKQQDELAQAQRNIEALLLAWGKHEEQGDYEARITPEAMLDTIPDLTDLPEEA